MNTPECYVFGNENNSALTAAMMNEGMGGAWNNPYPYLCTSLPLIRIDADELSFRIDTLRTINFVFFFCGIANFSLTLYHLSCPLRKRSGGEVCC